MAVAPLDQHGPASRRARRIIDRADQCRLALDIGQRLALVEGMVAQGDNIGASIAQALEMTFDQPFAVTGILAIDHDEIELVLRNKARQALGHRIATGPADDITKKQKSHALTPKKRTPCSVITASRGMS